MDLHTGKNSQPEGPTPLRAVPGVDAGGLTEAFEDAGDVEDVREDRALLRDATLVTARQRLDGLLLQLAVNPFDPAAYRGLGCYLGGPGVPALAVYQRVSASIVRGM